MGTLYYNQPGANVHTVFSDAVIELISSKVLVGTCTEQPEAFLGVKPEHFHSSAGSWIKPEKGWAASARLLYS